MREARYKGVRRYLAGGELLQRAENAVQGKPRELYVYLEWSASEYVVTNRRVILKTGIISRRTFEMRLGKIESISFNQSIMERLLNYGDITITGTGDTSQEFRDISNPLKFKLMTEQEMEKARY